MLGISRIFFTDSNTKNPLFVYLPAAILKRYRKWWMPGNIHPPNTAELNGACESSDDDEMTILQILSKVEGVISTFILRWWLTEVAG